MYFAEIVRTGIACYNITFLQQRSYNTLPGLVSDNSLLGIVTCEILRLVQMHIFKSSISLYENLLKSGTEKVEKYTYFMNSNLSNKFNHVNKLPIHRKMLNCHIFFLTHTITTNYLF